MIDCQVLLQNNVLTLETGRIRYQYRWNNGRLIGLRIEDVTRGHGWNLAATAPDLDWIAPDAAAAGQLDVTERAATSTTPAYLRAEVITTGGSLALKRVFRLYPDCPAISCDLYLRGRAPELDAQGTLARLQLPGVHWHAKAVQFLDVTDHHNTLVHTEEILPFRYDARMVGNLLFLDEVCRDRGLFILKESPGAQAHLNYPGCDFLVRIGEVRAVGLGLTAADLDPERWTRAYGVVTGVTGDGELGRLQALRDYQTRLRLHAPDRDEMVMMNTWGDRGQDTRLDEAFALAELEAGARLGISHFQLDDGWQSGRSSNSAYEGGSLEGIWDDPAYWRPHPERFPRGLRPVVERGRELGIEVCVWFNPSKDESYAHWAQDAETLIGLYRDYGIRTFKIDGVQVPDKAAEVNLRRMFDAVRVATEDQAVFNLDVTAGRRYGYHYFNEYGNIFLENRYTDWSNYYPHWTLRNLWMLSRYVPAQNLQIEFLNVWRNPGNYALADPLAPANVPFAYAFALTMMAQPLAWFEGTGLPEAAFEIAELVRIYRAHQAAIHAGQIFPIGEEPSGAGWTGFQSVGADEGYVLLLREHNERPEAEIRLHGVAHTRVHFDPVIYTGSVICTGSVIDTGPVSSTTAAPDAGASFDAVVGADGAVHFALPTPHSFALYRYHIPPGG
jgi:alpha-galactosidase